MSFPCKLSPHLHALSRRKSGQDLCAHFQEEVEIRSRSEGLNLFYAIFSLTPRL